MANVQLWDDIGTNKGTVDEDDLPMAGTIEGGPLSFHFDELALPLSGPRDFIVTLSINNLEVGDVLQLALLPVEVKTRQLLGGPTVVVSGEVSFAKHSF